MSRYFLKVFDVRSTTPSAVIEVERGADVMERMRELLREHPGCERITVEIDGVLMFAVDCEGSTLPRH